MTSGFFDSADPSVYDIRTIGDGPAGSLPVDDRMLRQRPSGDLFGWTQDAGMGWNPRELGRPEFLLLGTSGGLADLSRRSHERSECLAKSDGTPVALGYHTGHWEVGLQMEAAARQLTALGAIPFAAFCTDPCDGRTQGTPGMFDSLPYRNDAAIVLGRLIRSLPTGRGVIGVATCDKGHPAMMMALAACGLPAVLVPGGVTLPAAHAEDAGAVQSLGARYAQGVVTVQEAAELGCRACG
jgi:dihydroxyacid dehydratase/phosphogluconate dehydratase